MYDTGLMSIAFLAITVISLVLPLILLYYTYKAWQRVLGHFDRVEALLEKIAARG